MIFVTVGTHEQPFTRLVEYMDKWAETHDEEVVIQSGFSTYEPKHCKWQHFYHQHEMDKFNADGRITQCRRPHRSMQTAASLNADGRKREPNQTAVVQNVLIID